ncbi:endoribonuclease Dicer [Ancistrocladus abbreviatus]
MGDDGLRNSQIGDSSAVDAVVPIIDPPSDHSWADEAEEFSSGVVKEKDPRKIARKYQLELCKRALEENVIVYLETGCGKTHIAVLLMQEMGCLIKKPQKNICVFLAPTVALVNQQFSVIVDSTNFKVGLYCGDVKLQKNHDKWDREIEQYEVFVMTPQMLLHSLRHCFIRMEMIALLIFDECHYAQLESNHPYAEIMKVHYNSKVGKLPRIFGMTASPVLGKGASIDSLETILHAKVCTVQDKGELESYVASPVVKIYTYSSNSNSLSKSYQMCLRELEEIKQQCTSKLCQTMIDQDSIMRTRKQLQKVHNDLLICLGSFGLWGALQASRILLKDNDSEENELIEANENSSDDSICHKYLGQASSFLHSLCKTDGAECDLSCTNFLKEPLFSEKILRLVGILSNFRSRPDMKCIIFVNRKIVARSLSYIVRQLKILGSWKCHFLAGVHSGLKSMSRKSTREILERFCSGELNLLVATKVGEEGLDIQTCCLVIRFDLPETLVSYIQSRGRARMHQSEFAFLVDSDNERELNLIESFKNAEEQMNMDVVSRTSNGIIVDFEEKIYSVESTGATISSQCSISLLHQYCAKLPRDEYFNPKPDFSYFDDVDGTICQITLPANAPIHEIASTPQSSNEAAKKDACLKACKELHQMGVLTDYLLPDQDTTEEVSVLDDSDSDSSDDEDSNRELVEMLVPPTLAEPWDDLEKPVCLNSYFIRFSPKPCDRNYKEFGFFIKAPLPREAERMEVDLHLTHGRSVITELIPSGILEFDEEEILLAQKFQEMFLKIILDRSEFVASFVPLENSEVSDSKSSSFYLLLPVIWNQYKSTMVVDWKLIRRCLSSPIFSDSTDVVGSQIPGDELLQLADGPARMNDIVNSLVYAVNKKSFFFVSQILPGKNGYSSIDDSTSHVEYWRKVYNVDLCYPEQPLLQVKQLFCLRNLLHDRKRCTSESCELEEHFFELPPELCQLKILGFSKEIGSSISLLPSIMHRLQNFLVAIELRNRLSDAFSEGAVVTVERVLEAVTTEKCMERFSLERLEVLGDAFLKFAASRHLFLSHAAIDEGQLTRKRSKLVNNSNLYRLATVRKLQVYIRDQEFDPCHFFALGRPCSVICTKETEKSIHSSNQKVRCSRHHQWLYRKTVADVVEALIGAYIVDSGFKAATAFLRWIGIQVAFEASQVERVCTASARFMAVATGKDIPAIEKSVGYCFLHTGLLLQAFIHPSYNKSGGGCYQRLEFLGDAVLDYLITSYLYSVYPKLKPGHLTDLRSVLVNNSSFARVAVNLSFHKFIIDDSPILHTDIDKYVNYIEAPDSEKQLLEEPPCPKALGDLVESCIGGIFLDTGFDLEQVWKVMFSILEPMMSFSKLQLNPIREVIEISQSHGAKLQFQSTRKKKSFHVDVKLECKAFSLMASATNRSKKAAKRVAAEKILANLQEQGYRLKSRSLEDLLKASSKMEAKLIGYDETPATVVPLDAIKMDNLRLEDPPKPESDPQPSSVKSQPVQPIQDETSITISETSGGSRKVAAKSWLHEICAANCWKLPVFECCKEEGPSHLRLFTYKVVVHVQASEDLVLECVGDPHSTKKAAEEHAAQGALWLLKMLGCI